MTRHFLTIRDLSKERAMALVKRAHEMKVTKFTSDFLRHKTIVLIFEKASTRTRISYQVGVAQLGGSTIFMTPAESQLGRSETLKDTARSISRYADGMVVRTFGQDKLDQLAKYGSVPVINALTNEGHPSQVMSDVLSMYELTPDLENIKVAWIGDGNNMANSWVEAATQFGFGLTIACPKGYEPDMVQYERAKDAGAKVRLVRDPYEAVQGAHYINTDVWASMGHEEQKKIREEAFEGYIVTDALMAAAAPGARFMHCLPAHRGEEVTDSVIEGPTSIVFDQAENRLHMQKAIMEYLYA